MEKSTLRGYQMELTMPTMTLLFKQLGLKHSESEIRQFIALHQLEDRNKNLSEASFWTAAQSDFLQQAIKEDANWAIVVDLLNSYLIGKHDKLNETTSYSNSHYCL